MDDQDRRRQLGQFVRTRRERLSPKSVGLPKGAARRTPGLRREEVAQLAAVSVTWYTWLEQGIATTVPQRSQGMILLSITSLAPEGAAANRLVSPLPELCP
jgi:Helix-turn-helix domain